MGWHVYTLPPATDSMVTPHRVIREAIAKSKDGRIDQNDFLNYCETSTRYSLFTPMEASIIFHFAGRGDSSQRLSLYDFGQLLDPRWRAPLQPIEKPAMTAKSFLNEVAHSVYNFVLGGEISTMMISTLYVDLRAQAWLGHSALPSCIRLILVSLSHCSRCRLEILMCGLTVKV